VRTCIDTLLLDDIYLVHGRWLAPTADGQRQPFDDLRRGLLVMPSNKRMPRDRQFGQRYFRAFRGK
jgi:hypothetical protein